MNGHDILGDEIFCQEATTPVHAAIKRVSERLGLHELFVNLYIGTINTLTTLGYRFSSGTETMHMGAIEAEFHVDTPVKYDRVTTMIGEEAVIEAFVDDIRPGDVVWDVGRTSEPTQLSAVSLLQTGQS